MSKYSVPEKTQRGALVWNILYQNIKQFTFNGTVSTTCLVDLMNRGDQFLLRMLRVVRWKVSIKLSDRW
jgi:hypothetical protein